MGEIQTLEMTETFAVSWVTLPVSSLTLAPKASLSIRSRAPASSEKLEHTRAGQFEYHPQCGNAKRHSRERQ